MKSIIDNHIAFCPICFDALDCIEVCDGCNKMFKIVEQRIKNDNGGGK